MVLTCSISSSLWGPMKRHHAAQDRRQQNTAVTVSAVVAMQPPYMWFDAHNFPAQASFIHPGAQFTLEHKMEAAVPFKHLRCNNTAGGNQPRPDRAAMLRT